MRVLWHLSHHSSARPDGWSGAPDEARWVREDLTPRVQARTWALGITLVLVDGDLQDHLPFHENYDAFAAPHYEADVHDEGGSFWGRAAQSTTPAADDRLGAIFWRRYSQLVGRPPDRFGWTNPNVTDYYGFRLTTNRTPGFLVEHGVGAPGAPDHDWLRANVDAIADTWALALAEFGGIKEEELAFATDPDAQAFKDDINNSIEAIKEDLKALHAAIAALGNAPVAPPKTLAEIAASAPAPSGYHWVETRLVTNA